MNTKPTRKPLTTPIPYSYAEVLGVDAPAISNYNQGRRSIPLDKCVILLKAAARDPYFNGVDLVNDLILLNHPELKPLLPFLCAKPKKVNARGKRKLPKMPK